MEQEQNLATEQSTALDKIKRTVSQKILPFRADEWDLDLELREPPFGKVRELALFYTKEDRKGRTVEDKLGYALAAECVFCDGVKLFKNTNHAQEVLAEQGARVVQKLLYVVRALCNVEEEELEMAEND